MIEVFKTNVRQQHHASMLVLALEGSFPGIAVNFDLDDCDCILRAEAPTVEADRIIAIVVGHGFECEVLL